MGAGRQKDERTKLMIDGYIKLHDEGFTPSEIAQHFKVSYSTVLYWLDEIAVKNNVSRESLLQEVHTSPKYWERQVGKLKIDISNLAEKFDKAIVDVDLIIKEINNKILEVG